MHHWFTFCAGFGLDAEIVAAVERLRGAGAKATPSLFMRTGLRQFVKTNRRHPALTIDPSGGESVEGVFMVIVTNTTPWTYFGDRPLEPTPDASFETGLDVFALSRLGTISTAAKLRRLLVGGPTPEAGTSRRFTIWPKSRSAPAGRCRSRSTASTSASTPRLRCRRCRRRSPSSPDRRRLHDPHHRRPHRAAAPPAPSALVWRIPQSEIAELHQICQIDRPRALRSDQPPG